MSLILAPHRLDAVALFAGLTPREVSRLTGLLRYQTFPAGTTVITAEQPGHVVYLILDGTIKVHVEQLDGVEVILAILCAGEIVGEMSLVDSLGRSAAAVTMEEATLAGMDRATFWECLRLMPTLTYNLTRTLSRRLRLANTQIQSLAALDVGGRVARQLLTFAQEYGEAGAGGAVTIPFRLTQSDLAGLIGASRVRVNQVLVEYKRRHYLSIDQYSRITIHDRAALAWRCH